MDTDYAAAVRQRMEADGCAVTEERVGQHAALVGYRSNWRMLNKLHLITTVARVPNATRDGVDEFVKASVTLVKQRHGAARGMQSGVVAIPALLADHADDDAIELVSAPYRLKLGGFAAMARPVIVELEAGHVHAFRGFRVWGAAFHSYIRGKVNLYFPEP
ncbi:hypothetical protein [Actinomadura rupiterrae]|uniref:hypothetical protein n=1 Tax=Actinomadura rupiterrae TaxID=559627 RepID=UPI0020A29EA9|nr:hypothetical protein [Actinomadura rupiterrae]MCP2339869.1 hypothetical protein [Actinomadura rupiterrae]